MDRYHCPAWAIGAMGAILFLLLLAVIARAVKQNHVDIVFKPDLESEATSPYKSLWNRGRMQ